MTTKQEVREAVALHNQTVRREDWNNQYLKQGSDGSGRVFRYTFETTTEGNPEITEDVVTSEVLWRDRDADIDGSKWISI